MIPLQENTAEVGDLVLGRYRVLRRLAKGGMGTIYLARSEGTAGFVRPAILKCLHPQYLEAVEFRKLFEREARIMSNLHHPSIVAVIDFASTNEQNVMVLEYVHGYSLRQWLTFLKKQKRSLPVEIAVEISLRVLRALDYMHTLRDADGKLLEVLHRDISPSNVLIDVHGHVKLADFGIASSNVDHTQGTSEVIKGKLPYLAPELFEGDPPSIKSDLYSAGLLLHELLLGRREFHAPTEAATIAGVINKIPRWIDDSRPDASPELSREVARALHKSPSLRHENVAELMAALEGLRRAPADETSRALSKMVEADFVHEDFATSLGVPSLAELRALWSEVSPELSPKEEPGPPIDDTTTTELLKQPDLGSAGQEPETQDVPVRTAEVMADARPRRRQLVPWLLLVGGLAAGVLYFFVGSSQEDSHHGTIVAVQEPAIDAAMLSGEPDGSFSSAVAREDASDAGSSTDAGARKPSSRKPGARKPGSRKPGSRKPGSRKPGSRKRALMAAFRKQRSKITDCAKNHATASDGLDLSIRFSVGVDGKVVAAELLPASTKSGALSKCLLRVARSTEFGPQPEPVRFRVPIQMRPE